MNNSITDFKAHVNNCTDESEADDICFSWLRLACMDNGEDGERARALLDIVKDILCG